MRHTPRDRLYERALRGRWNLFAVSPESFYERLANGLGEGYRSKGGLLSWMWVKFVWEVQVDGSAAEHD